MSSKTLRDTLLSMIQMANERGRLPERIVMSTMQSVAAMSAREWLVINGQELRQLPTGIVVNDAGNLTLAPDAQGPVSITWPKVTIAQEATIQHLLLEGMGVDISIIKEYPAANDQPATTREFEAGQLPLITDNFALKLTFQPGAMFGKLGVLYEINV